MKEILKVEELEDVKVKIEKGAFEPKTLVCSKCNVKMKKSEMEINLEGVISVKLHGFECPDCKKRSLGLGEAKKLDKAMIVSRIVRNEFNMQRSLSYDGDY